MLGRGMTEYILRMKKKSQKKWNCNKIGKLFIIDKRIKKKHRHVGVQRIGNHESFELAPLNYCYILTLLALLLLFLILFFVTTFKYWLNVNWRIYSWIVFLLWNRVLIMMWDEAGFLFSMWDKYSVTLRGSVIIKLLALFNAIKIVLHQWPHTVFDCLVLFLIPCV